MEQDTPMADVPEGVARVGLAFWSDRSQQGWDTEPILGAIGDQMHLVEIDARNRERVLMDIIDDYDVDDRCLWIEIAFFGDAGGFFASSVSFLELWPRSPAEVPADVFVDNNNRAAFTKAGDEVVMSVRHALRPSDRPPKRRFRFAPGKYEEAMSELAQQSRRLRDDLIAAAQRRAPQKLESLREAFKHWPC